MTEVTIKIKEIKNGFILFVDRSDRNEFELEEEFFKQISDIHPLIKLTLDDIFSIESKKERDDEVPF